MLFAVAFGKVIFERPILKLPATGSLEPGHIFRVFRALQQLLVFLDWENNGDWLALSRYDLWFAISHSHGR